MPDFIFTNDYLEEATGVDLDDNSVIGDGIDNNASAPADALGTPLNAATYQDGENYIVAGLLASVSALDAVKTYFTSFNSANSITFGSSSSYVYSSLKDTASNLSAVSSTDLGNVTGTLTVSDSPNSPALISVLQSIKSNFSGSTFTYNGV